MSRKTLRLRLKKCNIIWLQLKEERVSHQRKILNTKWDKLVFLVHLSRSTAVDIVISEELPSFGKGLVYKVVRNSYSVRLKPSWGLILSERDKDSEVNEVRSVKTNHEANKSVHFETLFRIATNQARHLMPGKACVACTNGPVPSSEFSKCHLHQLHNLKYLQHIGCVVRYSITMVSLQYYILHISSN